MFVEAYEKFAMTIGNIFVLAGAELCQAQHCFSLLHTSLDFATYLLGLLAQPAVDGAAA